MAKKSRRPPEERLATDIRRLVRLAWNTNELELRRVFDCDLSHSIIQALIDFHRTHPECSFESCIGLATFQRDRRRRTPKGTLPNGVSRVKIWTPRDITTACDELTAEAEQGRSSSPSKRKFPAVSDRLHFMQSFMW